MSFEQTWTVKENEDGNETCEKSNLCQNSLSNIKINRAAIMSGSLPNGCSVGDVPVFSLSVSTIPQQLRFALFEGDNPPKRDDIELIDNGLAFKIDNVISKQVADLLLEITERIGYNEAAPGIRTPPGMRVNKALHLVLPDTFSNAVFQRIQHLLPQELDDNKLRCLSSRLNCYKYDSGDRFRMHVDGDWPAYCLGADEVSMVECPGMLSKLSLLLYLNDDADGVQGGATRLYGTQGSGRTDSPVDVQPTKGSALFFRHGFGSGSILHEGTQVGQGSPKYVCRINVMYDV